MKTLWKKEKLGVISTIDYGYTESASFDQVGPRFLRITDIQDDSVDWKTVPYCPIEDKKLAKFRLADGDIVFARTGATTGKSFLVENPPEAVFASYLIRLRVRPSEAAAKYVAHFFRTGDYWQAIKSGVIGSAQGGFNASKLGEISIPLPTLSEQRRIAAILDEADGVRRKHLEAAGVAEEMLDGLYKTVWQGKPKPIGHGVTSCETWNPMKADTDAGFFYIDIASVDRESKQITAPQRVSAYSAPSRARQRVQTNDVLVSTVRPNLNAVAHVGKEWDDATASTGFCVLRPQALNSRYLFHWVRTSQFVDDMTRKATGASYPAVSDAIVRRSLIPTPDMTTQTRIASLLDEADRVRQLHAQAANTAADLLASLSQRAFQGKL